MDCGNTRIKLQEPILSHISIGSLNRYHDTQKIFEKFFKIRK